MKDNYDDADEVEQDREKVKHINKNKTGEEMKRKYEEESLHAASQTSSHQTWHKEGLEAEDEVSGGASHGPVLSGIL